MPGMASTNIESEAQWEELKERVRQLYLVDEKSVKDIRSQLRQQGLAVKPKQLEYRLKKWNFRRNLSQEASSFVAYKIKKRQTQGKKSEVVLSGVRLPKEKLERALRRHGFVSTVDRVRQDAAATPQLSEDWPITISTPLPRRLDIALDGEDALHLLKMQQNAEGDWEGLSMTIRKASKKVMKCCLSLVRFVRLEAIRINELEGTEEASTPEEEQVLSEMPKLCEAVEEWMLFAMDLMPGLKDIPDDDDEEEGEGSSSADRPTGTSSEEKAEPQQDVLPKKEEYDSHDGDPMAIDDPPEVAPDPYAVGWESQDEGNWTYWLTDEALRACEDFKMGELDLESLGLASYMAGGGVSTHDGSGGPDYSGDGLGGFAPGRVKTEDTQLEDFGMLMDDFALD